MGDNAETNPAEFVLDWAKQQVHLIQQPVTGIMMAARNGMPLTCPFQQPILQQSNDIIGGGQTQMRQVPQPCSSQCPHFELRDTHPKPSPENQNPEPFLGLWLTCGLPGKVFRIESNKA